MRAEKHQIKKSTRLYYDISQPYLLIQPLSIQMQVSPATVRALGPYYKVENNMNNDALTEQIYLSLAHIYASYYCDLCHPQLC